ncbi:hypothetical protein [Salarchaeum japonicum]|uniref:hypothetical protein n=1 Tax=Salarchaeum japonicum TaxID=555573 RepID=UPI003C790918
MFGTFLLLAGAALVALSGPVVLAAFRLREYLGGVRGALYHLLTGVLGLAAVVAVAAGVMAGISAGLVVLLVCLLVFAAGAAVPLVLASTLAERVGGVRNGAPYAALGWPPSLYAAALVFIAPGGFARYNLTFATGTTALVGWTAFSLFVLFGPAVVAVAAARYSTSRASSAP